MSLSIFRSALIGLCFSLLYQWCVKNEGEPDRVMQANKTCALAVKDFLQGHLRKMRLWRRVMGERPGIRRSRGKGRPAWFLLGILLLSGDVELNPGPKTGAVNKGN